MIKWKYEKRLPEKLFYSYTDIIENFKEKPSWIGDYWINLLFKKLEENEENYYV